MEKTFDLRYLWNIFISHIWSIVIVAIVFSTASYLVSEFYIPKVYTSSAMLYVENKLNTSESVNVNDISAAQKLVNTCQILFKSNSVMEQLKEELHLDYSVAELNEMIVVQSVNSTEVLRISTESRDAVEAAEITNKLVDISQDEFKRVVESGAIKVVDYAQPSTRPSSPRVLMNVAVALFLGVLLPYALFFLIELFDVRVKDSDDLYEMYKIPVFAEIVDFDTSVKGDKYGYKKSESAGK